MLKARYLYKSVVPNEVFSVILSNNLTSMDVTKLFTFVKECPLRFYKYSHKKICCAQKAHKHCMAVKNHEIFVICLYFPWEQMICCWFLGELILYYLKILSYLNTLAKRKVAWVVTWTSTLRVMEWVSEEVK